MDSALSVFAKDKKTGRIVHIQDVAEGYQHCICTECDGRMVAANRNLKTRKVDIYFRHYSDANCSGMTALHKYAQQLLLESSVLFLPEFNRYLVRNDLDDLRHDRRVSVEAHQITYQNPRAEQTLERNKTRKKSDVAVDDVTADTLHIEVYVTHKVDDEKKQFYENNRLDVIEIDLSELSPTNLQNREEIDSAVLKNAPRSWLSVTRYAEKIQAAQSVLDEVVDAINERIERERNKARRRARKRQGFKRQNKVEWRETNKTLTGLIEEYQDGTKRENVQRLFDNRCNRKGTQEHAVYTRLMVRHGCIPSLVNHPVEGELAFKVHRLVWQSRIFETIIVPLYDSMLKAVNHRDVPSMLRGKEMGWDILGAGLYPCDVYNNIKENIPLNRVAKMSEDMAGEAINLESFRRRAEALQYLTVKEYAALPKAIPVIRRYLLYLVKKGILKNDQGDVFELPYKARPLLK